MPLVELQDGSTVVFLTPGAQGDFEAQGLFPDTVKLELKKVAEQGAKVIIEAAQTVREALKSAMPSELELEIGMAISKEGNIIVASAKAEGSLKIKVAWKS